MAFDELTLDTSEGASSSSEAPKGQSEKQRESSRRAQAQLQKVQKDEKKAKTDNEELFRILSRFIQNPLYEDLIGDITILLQNNFPSRFLLFLISIVYPEAAYHLLDNTGQGQHKHKILSLYHYKEPTPFNDSIHPTLRDWITLWLTTGEQFITHSEASVVLVHKFSNLISSSPQADIAKKSLARVFLFFFTTKNVVLSPEKSLAYSEFILSQLKTKLDSCLVHMDSDLKEHREIRERDMFGI